MAPTVQNPGRSSGGADIWRSTCEKGRDQDVKCAGDISLMPSCHGNAPLHLAAMSGSAEDIKLLLNEGARTDVKNADLNTPLHLAAKLKSSECLKILLEVKDKVWEKNESQNTALHCAAEACCAESIKLLIDHVSGTLSLDLEREINLPNSSGRTPLHLFAQSGSLECVKVLAENKCAVSIADASGNTALHCAAMSGSPDCVKYLIASGADLLLANTEKCTALQMVLSNVPNGEDIVKEILDECVGMTKSDDGKEEVRIKLKVLCPETKNRIAIANGLYTSHRDRKKLLLHPLLKSLIRLEWHKSRYVMWYRFTAYLLYLLTLTVFVSLSPGGTLSTMIRAVAGFLSVHVMLFCFPYLLPAQYSWYRRITKVLLTAIPPTLTLVSVCIPNNSEWCGVSFLLSWLSTPMHSSAIYMISQQTGMFIFVTKEILKHSLVLFFVLVGFAVTFFVLYHEKYSDFSNVWYSFLYTTLVLLQGDSIGDVTVFGGNSTANVTSGGGYVSYITEALFNMRFASIIASLLFVFLVIIALLNMLVALAVRGGDDLMDYGRVYHLWCQVQLLYEWHEVQRFFSNARITRTYGKFHGHDYVLTADSDVPMSLRHELRAVAKYRDRKRGSKLTVSAVEAMVEEVSRRLQCEMKDLRESLMTALKNE